MKEGYLILSYNCFLKMIEIFKIVLIFFLQIMKEIMIFVIFFIGFVVCFVFGQEELDESCIVFNGVKIEGGEIKFIDFCMFCWCFEGIEEVMCGSIDCFCISCDKFVNVEGKCCFVCQ